MNRQVNELTFTVTKEEAEMIQSALLSKSNMWMHKAQRTKNELDAKIYRELDHDYMNLRDKFISQISQEVK